MDHIALKYKEHRAVSGVFLTIDPPPPLHPASVSSPRTKGGGGGTHSPGGVGGGGGGVNINGKTLDIGLASYSIIPLRFVYTVLCRGFLPVPLYVVMAAMPFYIYVPVCKLCGVL